MAVTSVGDVFSAASQGFARWTPLLWEPVGRASVAAAGISPGDTVLDACCGTGASAIPAAEAAGPDGHVDGVDLSDGLLAVARGRAAEAGVGTAVFHAYDVTRWTGGPYDAVLCVFGVFFLPDMDAGAAHLLSQARPGGRFVVTTWEQGSPGPLLDAAREAAAAETGVTAAGTASQTESARVGTADLLRGWLTSVGVVDAAVERFERDVPLTPELAWDLIVGSGARRMLDGLDEAAVARVRADFERRRLASGIEVLPVRALIGSGTRAAE